MIEKLTMPLPHELKGITWQEYMRWIERESEEVVVNELAQMAAKHKATDGVIKSILKYIVTI